MSRFLLPLCACLVLESAAPLGQAQIVPSDNLIVPGNAHIVLHPGKYLLPDQGSEGVLILDGIQHTVIEGDSVSFQGNAGKGICVLIRNCRGVELRNFGAAKGYFYAVKIEQSDSITITGCNFSDNMKDTSGFIDVWGDKEKALGGGVFIDSSRACLIEGCTMRNSNDGVALYHSRRITIRDNDLSWNTAFGIRMFFSDSNAILRNNASHVYREQPVNSDAGAILMIVSNVNEVRGNDFSYSSDGIFLGQYGHHMTPNKNIFTDNDCSYSPHNAIEATFADGNVFKRNKCNASGYGLWLGYSFNTIVDSNEIMGNHQALSVGTAGIAIDRGFNNTITNNRIENNALGVWLWDGDAIPGYESQHSKQYLIAGNSVSGNWTGMDLSNTRTVSVAQNAVRNNVTGISVAGVPPMAVTISGNSFDRTIAYALANYSYDDIDARYNQFNTDDSLEIAGMIYDSADDPSAGSVLWYPYLAGFHPGVEKNISSRDLTEPSASDFGVFASDGQPSTPEWDSSLVKEGIASLKVETASGYDVNIHRWPLNGWVARWDLSGATMLSFWVRAQNTNDGQFQALRIKLLGKGGGYFEFTAPASLLSSAIGKWVRYTFPLTGDATWQRTVSGPVTMAELNAVEIHADTWGGGFVLWIDGLSLTPVTGLPDPVAEVPLHTELSQNYPNPFNPTTTIQYQISQFGYLKLSVFDLLGREIAVLVNDVRKAGKYSFTWNASGMPAGVYFCRLTTGDVTSVRKLLLIR